MPAAELFGSIAVLLAVERERGDTASSIIFIGDCDPANQAINAGSSKTPQMRELLSAIRQRYRLAVSIPREINLDADRLSHPSLLIQVEADILAADPNTRVIVAQVHDEVWDLLRKAIGVGVHRS
jgi:hypothetical protein